MSRTKLMMLLLMILLAAAQAFGPFQTWYSPYIIALLIILLTALVYRTEQGDDF